LLLIILSYVDNNLTIGKRSAIDAFLKEFKESEFTFTLEEGLSDYLSCDIQMDRASLTGWIGQPHMVKKIEKTFGEDVSKLQSYTIPERLDSSSRRQSTMRKGFWMNCRAGSELESGS
jgi:hypothetical protein